MKMSQWNSLFLGLRKTAGKRTQNNIVFVTVEYETAWGRLPFLRCIIRKAHAGFTDQTNTFTTTVVAQFWGRGLHSTQLHLSLPQAKFLLF
jgi:hypothetical protein